MMMMVIMNNNSKQKLSLVAKLLELHYSKEISNSILPAGKSLRVSHVYAL